MNANYGQDSTFAGATTAGDNSDANGYGDFKYFRAIWLQSISFSQPDRASHRSEQYHNYDQHLNSVIWFATQQAAEILLPITPQILSGLKAEATQQIIICLTALEVNNQLLSNSTKRGSCYKF